MVQDKDKKIFRSEALNLHLWSVVLFMTVRLGL